MDLRPPNYPDQAEIDSRPQRLRLAGLCLLMLAGGAAFAAFAGPPRLPDQLPSLHGVLSTLAGSTVPVAAVVLVLVDVVWLLWIWIAGSLCLELALVGVEAIAHGAAWVRSLRGLADRLSVPLVRRAVAAAFAVQVISRGVPIAAAQTIAPPETTLVTAPHSTSDAEADVPTAAAPTPTYLVREGDTLWSIAERIYGSGEAYPRVIEANLGRHMLDGRVFSALGVIRPGWQLAVPGAATPIEEVDGQRWYTVRPDDTLSSIAATTLGDEAQWNELFAANEGAMTPDGLHTLHDADVIWPGLRLRLPDDQTVADPAHVDELAEPAADAEPVDLVAASAAPGPPAESDPSPAAEANLAPSADANPAPTVDNPIDPPPVVPEPTDAAPDPDLPPLGRTPHDSLPLPDPAPVATADADASVPNAPWHRDPDTLVPFALGALGALGAAAAVAGLAFGVRRRRRLRPLPRQPESDVVVQGGFAEVELTHDLSRGLHGVGFDPVAALVSQFHQFLAEYNLGHVRMLTVSHGRSSTTIRLQCSLAEQAILVDLAPEFAHRLGAEVEPSVSVDQDVVLRLTGLRRTRLLPAADGADQGPCLVPLGILYDKQAFAAEWNSLGNVLVVSLPGHGADTIVASFVAALTAHRSPEQLRIWMIGSRRALPAPLFDVPHLAEVVDPADEIALSTAAAALRAELERRANHRANHRATADLAVVVPELATLGEHAETFALLASRSSELGVRFVVASSRPDDVLACPMTSEFGTRMVLRMQSEEASVALLGVRDAASLPGGGRLCLRIDGREVVELYGYQVSAERLDRLVTLMRSAYSVPSTPLGPIDTPPAMGVELPSAAEPSVPETAPSELSTSMSDSTPVAESSSSELQACAPSESGARIAARPPVEVLCFGGPRVMYAGQQVWPRAGGDAKPWELLLYVACQPAEGASRRNVVEALWPDDEQPEDSTHRIRQLRYRLRKSLTDVEGGPQTDGVCLDQYSLRLDPAVIYSDAQEFLTLVSTARLSTNEKEAIHQLERARGLYAGDLLDGLGARRYAWVEERDNSGVTLREHFRRLFQQASQHLAELYAHEGELSESIRIYRELTEIDPTDERLWLALFRLHAQRGDRPELMREEIRMRTCLRELADEADLATDEAVDEPSREMAEEFERLLASLRDREPATV